MISVSKLVTDAWHDVRECSLTALTEFAATYNNGSERSDVG